MNGQIQDQVGWCRTPGVLGALRQRADRGGESTQGELAQTAATALERYFYLLANRRGELRGQFSDSELGLLCDACNGSRYGVASNVKHLPIGIEDAVKLDRLDQKWEIDGAALVSKLKELDLLSLCTLVDGIERFWSGAYHKENADFSQVLATGETAEACFLAATPGCVA